MLNKENNVETKLTFNDNDDVLCAVTNIGLIESDPSDDDELVTSYWSVKHSKWVDLPNLMTKNEALN